MERYNASKITKTILEQQGGYYEKDGYIIGISSFINGVSIEFCNRGKTVLLLQAYDLTKSKSKDVRPAVFRFNYYENEIIPFTLSIDFDDMHHKKKQIHLNLDYESKKNLKLTPFQFLENKLDHFTVDFNVNEKEKTILINFEKTLLSLLNMLKNTSFYRKFDSYNVNPIHPTDNSLILEVQLILEANIQNRRIKISSRIKTLMFIILMILTILIIKFILS